MSPPPNDDRITIPWWVVWTLGALAVVVVLGLSFIYLAFRNLSW